MDYTIKHFYPEIEPGTKSGYTQFFEAVAEKTLDMIIQWERVGFVHGVMNTDNMSILGVTIDYGPYGWLEDYNKRWTPNTTDREHKRYQFGQQANIALWNLFKLANALYPLIEESEPFEKGLENYKLQYRGKHLEMMKAKLGLQQNDTDDVKLIQDLETNLQLTEIDMTIFFRNLSKVTQQNDRVEEGHLAFLSTVQDAFYNLDEVKGETHWFWKGWMARYKERLKKETLSDEERAKSMNSINPKYVLRNYMAQVAIDAADNGDYSIVDELYTLLKKPYDEQPEHKKWFVKRPEWARTKVGCSMLSCSS